MDNKIVNGKRAPHIPLDYNLLRDVDIPIVKDVVDYSSKHSLTEPKLTGSVTKKNKEYNDIDLVFDDPFSKYTDFVAGILHCRPDGENFSDFSDIPYTISRFQYGITGTHYLGTDNTIIPQWARMQVVSGPTELDLCFENNIKGMTETEIENQTLKTMEIISKYHYNSSRQTNEKFSEMFFGKSKWTRR